jgi:hypothetical protein
VALEVWTIELHQLVLKKVTLAGLNSLRQKVLNFNMIFHDYTICFSKYQNKAEFKNLDDSEVLSSDFPDVSATSVTSTASKPQWPQ